VNIFSESETSYFTEQKFQTIRDGLKAKETELEEENK
jgi:hypothetical protein